MSAKEIHISINGDDSHPGTSDRPVATPRAARDIVRRHIARGLHAPVQVLFGEGVHFLAEPLSLTPEDSGTADCPITWRAADGARAVLSGGVRIGGTWRRDERGVWSVALPEVADGWNFRQLFVDGRRAIRARYPNADDPNPFLYATGGGRDHVVVDPGRVKSCWGAAPDAQINIVPNWRFFNQWNTVTGVDAATGRIDIADSERHAEIIPGSWFWIEGVAEELDRPGEWHLDPAEGRLHYMPEPGVDPNGLEFIAPRLNVLVDLRGDVEQRTHVEHLVFSGLEFRHTTFTLGQIEARVHTDAAIRLENASHCRFEDCVVEHVGGYAFWLHLDCRHNGFDRNRVADTGGGGVLMTGARLSYMDDSKRYTPGEVAATVFPILNRVTRNTVRHCGRIRYYGGGVHLDSRPSGMAMEPGNYIAHNHFEDLSRNGIFAFRNQGGNVVEYNHIHDAMQTTIDGACIHFATMNHLNAPNHILNNWLHDIWGYEQKPDGTPIRRLGNGIFLDWDTSNTTVKDNWIYNAVGGAVKPIWDNCNLRIEDNEISETRIVPPFAGEIGPAGTATSGITLEDNRLTGGVVHHSDRERVQLHGPWETRTFAGVWKLFEFHTLVAPQGTTAWIRYDLPIREDGRYEISLLYKRGEAAASNAKLAIHHAGGIAELRWDLRKGSPHGFAVAVGTFPFQQDRPAALVLSNEGADGEVVADAVAYVKGSG